MTIEVTIKRYYGSGLTDLRKVRCKVDRLREAHDAAAQELGFASWEKYSVMCGMPEPQIMLVRQLRQPVRRRW